MANWKSGLIACAALLLALSAPADARFHLYKIQQIYSNADGTVQFVVLSTIFDNEHEWQGHSFGSTDGKEFMSFPFDHNLPDAATSGKSVLIATQGFAALGIITPDYVIPDDFIPRNGGTVDFASVDSIMYESGQLPLDGVNALNRDGSTGPNVAKNFAGDTASVALGSPGGNNYQGLWWKSPANSESGWGVNLAHQGDTMFASWFTYDTAGKAWWLVATLDKQAAANTYAGKLYSTRGPAFSANPWDPATVTSAEQGTATVTFTDANNGTFRYVIGAIDQSKPITREVFGTLPSCTFPTGASLSTATNYQDLWWKKPGGSESGWGINLNHQGDTIFATWFTYDVDGSPLWLVASASKVGVAKYQGELYRTIGPAFNAVPFDSTKVTPTKVGTATFTFADGNNANFDYTVQLAGMGSPVTQSKAITREIFSAPGTMCR